jgi:hypothetical protein
MITTLWYPIAQAALRQQGYEDAGDGKRFKHKKHGRVVNLEDFPDMEAFMSNIRGSMSEALIDIVLARKSI